MRVFVCSLSFIFLASCGGGSKTNGSDGQDGSDTADQTDGTEGTDGVSDAQDGTDATDQSDGDDGDDSGRVPECQFTIQDWWECNPWPNCPESGCKEGEYCTLLNSSPPRIACIEIGEVPQGGECNHDGGPYCSEGLCVDGGCRLFCNDNPDCENSACLPIGGGPLTHISACGAAQGACDPLKPTEGCDLGQICYYHQNTGLSSCAETKKEGEDGAACDCPNCCTAGQACVVHDNNQICGPLCVQEGDGEPQCQTECLDKATKILEGVLGVCVPSDGGDPPPDPIPCNILAQDCDGAAQACYPTNQGDQCLVKGNKPKGGSCENVNECAKGLACVAGKCKTVCDPNNPLGENCSEANGLKCSPLGNSAGGYCDE